MWMAELSHSSSSLLRQPDRSNTPGIGGRGTIIATGEGSRGRGIRNWVMMPEIN